jgi:transcriptional regulator with XRE-family HTH domain
MLPVGIGDAIRARRERAGLTQESLGALLGVHPDVVDEWEWGEGAPDAGQARRLAVILGLPPDGFLDRIAGGDRDAVLVHLLPAPDLLAPAVPAVATPASNPALVPPRPTAPPPLPVRCAPAGGRAPAGDVGAAPAVALPAPVPVARAGLRRLVAGAVAALLVLMAGTSGLAAYRQSQLAARYEAEARALRITLVVLAGERDRLAARLADLSDVLAEAGISREGAEAAARP